LVTANPIIGKLHLLFATLLFAALIYFSLFLFTKSKTGNPLSTEKIKRNCVYRFCGFTMLGCILLIAVYYLFLKSRFPGLENIHPVFWLESLALLAFGISWFTKGQAILKDVQSK
jgi:quinol-cytochrome oxidoreductase complex cytochrome b subunit